MRIILSGAFNPRFEALPEYLASALRRLGHRVILFDHRAFLIPGRLRARLPLLDRFDRDRLEGFIKALPDSGRYAMEFRHASWEEAREFLAERGVAWCTAETDEQKAERDAWEPFGYLRLRKETYTDEEIRRWADRIASAIDAGHDVYCYFKHEEKGIGPVYAQRLAEILS